RTVAVNVAGGLTQPALLYRFTAASRLASAGSASAVAGALGLSLPARSATLAVTPLTAAPSPATQFYTVAPCRAVDTRTTPAGPAVRCNQPSGTTHVILDVNGYFE